MVEGAGFTVRARDKVGLVGRNGAGKTSLFRVLGGAAQPTAGTVHRSGALGYLPQDPRLAGLIDGITACATSCRARPRRGGRAAREAPAAAGGGPERAQRRPATPGPRSASSTTAATPPTPRSAASPHGLGLGADRLDLPLGVLSGGERRRVELARILFAGSDVLLLDEPTNHLDADAKAWLMKFLRGYRGALLVISHDLDLLDEAITRVLHLDRPGEESTGTLVEYQGTYSQYLAARAADEVRLAKLAAEQQAEIDRLQTPADRFRAKAPRPRWPTAWTSGSPASGRAWSTPRRRGRHLRVALPRAAALRPRRARGRGSHQGLRRPAGVQRRHASTSAGASGCSCSASTARARPACCASSPARPTPTPAPSGSGHDVVGRLLRPGARRPRSRPIARRPPPRAGAAAAPTRAARPARHVRAHRREGVPGGRHAVGRREDEAGAGPARRRPPQPAAARRAHQQPRPAEPRRRGRRAGAVAGVDGDRQPRRGRSCAGSSPTGCCSCPTATSTTGPTTCSTSSPSPERRSL